MLPYGATSPHWVYHFFLAQCTADTLQEVPTGAGSPCGDTTFPKPAPVHLPAEFEFLNDCYDQDYAELGQKIRGQAQCQEWVDQRKTRLTAPNFGAVMNRKASVTEKFIQNILMPKAFSSAATSHGTTNEAKAKD